MKKAVLTPEQKETFKNCFFICGDIYTVESGVTMYPIGDIDGLSKDNFRAFWYDGIAFYELTVDDFEWVNPKKKCQNFKFKYISYISGYYMTAWVLNVPQEVIELLDAAIKERNAEKEK